MDSKSIGLCPQGFESPRCRFLAEHRVQGPPSRLWTPSCHVCIANDLAQGGQVLASPSAWFPPRAQGDFRNCGGEKKPWPPAVPESLTRRPGFQDSVSERLRRWTRNPLGSARRGSNPLAVAFPPIPQYSSSLWPSPQARPPTRGHAIEASLERLTKTVCPSG